MAQKTPKLPDKAWAWFDSAFRPLNDFYLWCQTVDDRIRAAAGTSEGLSEDLSDLGSTKAGLAQPDLWVHFIPKAKDGDYVVVPKLPFAVTITSVVTDCDSGSCTATTKIDGVALGGGANSVTTTEQDKSHASTNVAAVGTTISYTISSNASCVGMRLQITFTRQLDA